jgi:hypothetical protein
MAGSDSDAEIEKTRLDFRIMLDALAVPTYGPAEV